MQFCFELHSSSLRYGKQSTAEIQAAMASKQEQDDKEQEVKSTPWLEPDTLQVLHDQYIVESKFAGRCPGTTLLLVQSKKRDGTTDQIQPNQRFKLFLASCH